jgi:hypothetical protein
MSETRKTRVPVPRLLRMSVESFVEKRILFFDHSGLDTAALYSLKFSPEFVLSKHFLRILGGQRQNFGTRMRASGYYIIESYK